MSSPGRSARRDIARSVSYTHLDVYKRQTIARVVTFKDPYLAEKKPEWCLKTKDGSVYRDKKGDAWINPYNKEVWEYLSEVVGEACRLGFDEVQFDYIRFNTDSTMKNVDFEQAGTEEMCIRDSKRVAVI